MAPCPSGDGQNITSGIFAVTADGVEYGIGPLRLPSAGYGGTPALN